MNNSPFSVDIIGDSWYTHRPWCDTHLYCCFYT